jgi:hypothetical protein
MSNVKRYSIKRIIMNKNKKSACSKDLVVWGTNLYSTVGIKLSQNELNIVKLSYFIKSVIIGILLSDGYIIFSTRSKNGRLLAILFLQKDLVNHYSV